MQPFPSPNYYNQYMTQNYNPVMAPTPRYVQPEQYQQNYQQSMLVGRVTDDTNTITANEIPMDGRFALFPKSDMSEIIAKKWSPDGNIITISYKAQTDAKMNGTDISSSNSGKSILAVSEEATNGIMERLNELYLKIEQLETKITPSRSKKESVSE